MSWYSRIAIFVVGMWGFAISPAWAKPPDLPAQQTVTCQPPAAEKPGSGNPTRTDIDFNALPKDLLVTEEEQESLEPLDLICPCFWEVLRSYGQSWSLSLVEIISGNAEAAGRTTPPAPGAECPSACPYLQQSRIQKTQRPSEIMSLPGSVLENLDKLEQAQLLWQNAEESRRNGDWNAACARYTQIQALCPGSSVARMATERLDDLHLISQSVPAKASGEQEPPAQPERPRQ